LSRIKVPAIIAQFTRALEKNQGTSSSNSAKVLFKLLRKYSPEDKQAKQARLSSEAKAKAESTFF
jgi:hypothetical protein